MKHAMMTVLAVAVVVALVAVVPASAAPIAIDLTSVAEDNVKASTTYNVRYPWNTSNWSGMDGTFPDGEHEDDYTTMWLTLQVDPSTQWISWDLGQVYTVGSMHVWNSNEPGCVGRGVKTFTLQTSADGSDGSWTAVSNIDWSNETLYKATGSDDYEGFDFTLPTSVTTQHIRFNAFSNYDGSNFVGLSEIVFYEIPEPATVSLLVMGAVGLVARRRRK